MNLPNENEKRTKKNTDYLRDNEKERQLIFEEYQTKCEKIEE